MDDAHPTGILIAILAAGRSRRMGGRDKLLEPVGGMALLQRVALAARATGAPVIVTLPPDAPDRAALLDAVGVDHVAVAGAAEGMAASLRAAAALADGRALLVMLADMPEIETGDLNALIAWFRASDGTRAVRAAAADGTPGNPVLLPPGMVAALADLTGDRGARDLLAGADPHCLPRPGRRAVTDLDTPEDWAAWRARTGR